MRRWLRAGGKALVAVILVVGVAGSLLWLFVRRPGQTGADDIALAQCRGGYRSARTAADTAAVDARRPVISRGQATVALTCGAMRRTGWLEGRRRPPAS